MVNVKLDEALREDLESLAASMGSSLENELNEAVFNYLIEVTGGRYHPIDRFMDKGDE